MQTELSVSAIVILALWTQRLITLWMLDEIMRRPRQWIQARGGAIGYFTRCPMCLSVWAAGLGVWLWLFGGAVGRYTVGVFAVAGGALCLDVVIGLASRLGRNSNGAG